MAKPGLRSHRKFLRFLKLSKLGDAEALGTLEYIWLSCADACSDFFKDSDELEAAAHWQGKPGDLAKWLKDAGFIEKRSGPRLVIHDYFDHAPDHVKKKKAYHEKELAENLRDSRRKSAKRVPYRSDSDPSPPQPKKKPRLPPSGTPNGPNRRNGSGQGGGKAPRGAKNAPVGVGEAIQGMFWGQSGPPSASDLPAPTVPIGAYNLQDCIAVCASWEKDLPPDDARKMWGSRLNKLGIYPTGLDFIREEIAKVKTAQHANNRKGVGPIDKPSAYMNKATGDYLREQERKHQQ